MSTTRGGVRSRNLRMTFLIRLRVSPPRLRFPNGFVLEPGREHIVIGRIVVVDDYHRPYGRDVRLPQQSPRSGQSALTSAPLNVDYEVGPRQRHGRDIGFVPDRMAAGSEIVSAQIESDASPPAHLPGEEQTEQPFDVVRVGARPVVGNYCLGTVRMKNGFSVGAIRRRRASRCCCSTD